MARLQGFTLDPMKRYAIGFGASKRLIKQIYNCDMDEWYIQFKADGWVRLDEYLVENPTIEIEEVDAEGRQIGEAAESTSTTPPAAVVDVTSAILPAPITGNETPSWMQ
jgi:hypothetical protein